jgi:hypothetical protein
VTAVDEAVHLTREIEGIGLLEFVETDKSRAYWLTPPGAKRRQRLPSVTTILRGSWPKSDGLLEWLIRQANPEAVREEAADRGKAVHKFVETYLTTGELLPFDDFPAAWHGYLRGAAGFLWDHDPQPLAVERLVCHPELRYAGRLDLIATLRDAPDAATLLDFKSNPKGNVYGEAHAQAAGYVIADARCGGDPIERVRLVGIAEDGSYQVVEGADASPIWHTSIEFYYALQRFEKAVRG